MATSDEIPTYSLVPGITVEVPAGAYLLNISTNGPGVTVTLERWMDGRWLHAGGLLPDASRPNGNGCLTQIQLPACGIRASVSPDTSKAAATLARIA